MTYKWVRHDGQMLFAIGVRPDGTLHNPNDYPEALVRDAIAAATARQQARRQTAAAKGVETRRRRRAARVHELATRWADGWALGPRAGCGICGRRLTDPVSIGRGIGSECWEELLQAIDGRIEAVTRA
jgi:hypothetical protein